MKQNTPPLSGVVVVDLSGSVAGQFCGRLFADHGATVFLGEPPAGTPTRREGPFARTKADRSRTHHAASDEATTESCLFWHLNLGKQVFSVPDMSAEGGLEQAATSSGNNPARDRLADLIASADVLIMDEPGQGYRFLSGTDGPPVVCDITSFGRTGPWKDWGGGELVHQALSGTMFENGQPDREPLYGVGHRASYAAGLIGYMQSVAAHRVVSTQRHVVDVSVVEVAASMNFNRATQYAYNCVIEDRDPRTIPRALVRCADGWVSLFIYDHRWHQSCHGLGMADLADDPRFQTEEARLFNWHAFVEETEKRFRTRTVEDVIAAGQRARAVIAKARSPVDLVNDQGLADRGYWDWRDGGRLPKVGPMFRFSATPQREPGDAPPAMGDHAVAPPSTRGPSTAPPVRSGTRRASGKPASFPTDRQEPPALARPLHGTRVIDLTTAWSGPMATRLLASLGADVLKIEGPSRIDDWRGPPAGGLPSRYPDRDQGARPYNRCYQFNTQNHDKRDVSLDLKNPAGRDIVLALLADADVLIANFRPGTLDRMGLSWGQLHELNPRLMVVEMPAYGLSGPDVAHVALGPSMEMMSGMARLVGYGDGRPVTTGPAYLDPIGGINTAAAVITALAARDRSGEGQHVEVAQVEAAMNWIGEELVYAAASGEWRQPRGNRRDDVAPHGVFPCLGFDEWVVIATPSDEAFASLCLCMGIPELANSAAFGTLPDRKAHEDELESRIAAWTAARDKHEVSAELQAVGVEAAPVCNARDLANSVFLLQRGLLQMLEHPEAGAHLYQGVPLHTSPWDLSIRQAAPIFGQHTDAVLRKELDLGDADLAKLAETGVTTAAPIGYVPRPSGPDKSTSEEVTVAVAGPASVRVRIAGPANASAMIFILARGAEPSAWDSQLCGLLATEYRVAIVDMKDCDDEVTASGILAAVSSELHLRRPIIVGWRAGAQLARRYVDHVGPRSVAGLCLVDWVLPAELPDALRTGSLACPVLLCYSLSSKDNVTDVAVRRTLAACPLARASRYERTGPPFLSDPRRFSLELADFVSRATRSVSGKP